MSKTRAERPGWRLIGAGAIVLVGIPVVTNLTGELAEEWQWMVMVLAALTGIALVIAGIARARAN